MLSVKNLLFTVGHLNTQTQTDIKEFRFFSWTLSQG